MIAAGKPVRLVWKQKKLVISENTTNLYTAKLSSSDSEEERGNEQGKGQNSSKQSTGKKFLQEKEQSRSQSSKGQNADGSKKNMKKKRLTRDPENQSDPSTGPNNSLTGKQQQQQKPNNQKYWESQDRRRSQMGVGGLGTLLEPRKQGASSAEGQGNLKTVKTDQDPQNLLKASKN